MSSQSIVQPLKSRLQNLHRIERLLLIALVIFLGALAVRVVKQATTAPEVVTPPAPVEPGTTEGVAHWQEKVRNNPENSYYYAQLGLAFLQRVRETGDASLYLQAEQALEASLEHNPEQVDALMGLGILANARHEFATALEWADQAWAINPFGAAILGVKVDALVELGRYEEAVETAQQMIDLRPGLPSYTRVSYLRELHGDMPGAQEAMAQAADVGMPGTEAWLWTQVQLGNLYFNNGDVAEAEAIYQEALRWDASYPFARAGLARVQATRGETEAAIATYRDLTERLPLPEFVIALGELYEATGQPEEAQLQYDLVRAMQQLNADAGMNVDLELALFEADHGDPAQALALARTAYEVRPSLHAADALAWALYHNGEVEEARRYSEEALRLGTRNAMLHYHAGMIAHALGDADAARTHLETALAINPHFSPLYAPEAEGVVAQGLRR